MIPISQALLMSMMMEEQKFQSQDLGFSFALYQAFADDRTVIEIDCNVCSKVLDRLQSIFGKSKLDFCAIFGFFDFEQLKVLKLTGATGYQPCGIKWTKTKIGEGLAGRVAQQKEKLISNDTQYLAQLGIGARKITTAATNGVTLLALPLLLPSGHLDGVFVVGKLVNDTPTQSFFNSSNFIDIISQYSKQIAIIHDHAVTLAKARRSKKYTTNERKLTATIRHYHRSMSGVIDSKNFMDYLALELMKILNAGNPTAPFYKNYLFYEFQKFRKRFILRSNLKRPRHYLPNIHVDSKIYKTYIKDGLVKSVESQRAYVQNRGKEPHIVRHIANKVEEIIEKLDDDWSPCGWGAAFIVPLFEDGRPLGILVFLGPRQNRRYINNPPFYLGPEKRQVSLYDLKVFRSLQPLIANEYNKLRVDEERQRGINDLKSILGAMKEVILLEDREEVLRRLAKIAAQSLNCEGALLHLLNAQKNQLELGASSGFDIKKEMKEELTFPLNATSEQFKSLPVRIFESQKTLLANRGPDFRRMCGNQKKFAPLFNELNNGRVISYLGMPIGQLGVIEVFNKSKINPSYWSFFEDQDYTTLRNISEAIATVLHRMEATASQVQSEKAKLTGELLLDISHELKNPLYTSLIFVRQLKDGLNGHLITNNQNGEWSPLEIIERNIEKAQKILRGMQDFQKIITEMRLQPVDLEKIIRIVIQTNGSFFDRQRIEVETQFSAPEPLVKGDEVRLNQVFTNLITNAMDAMPTGGRLVARLYETDGHLHAEIEDTGLGIPTTIRDKVFEPFFTTKHSGKGTGLGLSLCRRIIAHHNGIIDFESQEDRGTKFVVKLPKIILQSALLAQQIDLRPSIQELDYDES